MEQLDLEGITVSYAQLTSSSTSKKRQATEWAQIITNYLLWFCHSSNRLILSCSIKNRQGCHSGSCQENFIKTVENHFTSHNTIVLRITFSNGDTLTIIASYYSFEWIISSEYLICWIWAKESGSIFYEIENEMFEINARKDSDNEIAHF
jgi:hypothetical protein